MKKRDLLQQASLQLQKDFYIIVELTCYIQLFGKCSSPFKQCAKNQGLPESAQHNFLDLLNKAHISNLEWSFSLFLYKYVVSRQTQLHVRHNKRQVINILSVAPGQISPKKLIIQDHIHILDPENLLQHSLVANREASILSHFQERPHTPGEFHKKLYPHHPSLQPPNIEVDFTNAMKSSISS